MIKACLFDLDGTLLNTLNSIRYFLNKTISKRGIREIEESYGYQREENQHSLRAREGVYDPLPFGDPQFHRHSGGYRDHPLLCA